LGIRPKSLPHRKTCIDRSSLPQGKKEDPGFVGNTYPGPDCLHGSGAAQEIRDAVRVAPHAILYRDPTPPVKKFFRMKFILVSMIDTVWKSGLLPPSRYNEGGATQARALPGKDS
jgi:hypothetical protein